MTIIKHSTYDSTLHISDIISLIYNTVGPTFTFNDVSTFVTQPQMSKLTCGGYVDSTKQCVKSNCPSTKYKDIRVWRINSYGLSFMKRFSNYKIKEKSTYAT